MEDKVIKLLSTLEKGYAYYSWHIADEIGLPLEETKKILQKLRKAGLIETMNIFSESTGLVAGKGYCLTNNAK